MVRPTGPAYRDIAESATRFEAALEYKRGGEFVGAETFRTQGGIWYWYCLDRGQLSDRQFRSEAQATAAAVAHDATFHVGRRQ